MQNITIVTDGKETAAAYWSNEAVAQKHYNNVKEEEGWISYLFTNRL